MSRIYYLWYGTPWCSTKIIGGQYLLDAWTCIKVYSFSAFMTHRMLPKITSWSIQGEVC